MAERGTTPARERVARLLAETAVTKDPSRHGFTSAVNYTTDAVRSIVERTWPSFVREAEALEDLARSDAEASGPTGTGVLVETIAVEANETDLSSFAQAIAHDVGEAIARLEASGRRIVGAVSIAQARACWTDVPEGTDREWTNVETGVIATLTHAPATRAGACATGQAGTRGAA